MAKERLVGKDKQFTFSNTIEFHPRSALPSNLPSRIFRQAIHNLVPATNASHLLVRSVLVTLGFFLPGSAAVPSVDLFSLLRRSTHHGKRSTPQRSTKDKSLNISIASGRSDSPLTLTTTYRRCRVRFPREFHWSPESCAFVCSIVLSRRLARPILLLRIRPLQLRLASRCNPHESMGVCFLALSRNEESDPVLRFERAGKGGRGARRRFECVRATGGSSPEAGHPRLQQRLFG